MPIDDVKWVVKVEFELYANPNPTTALTEFESRVVENPATFLRGLTKVDMVKVPRSK